MTKPNPLCAYHCAQLSYTTQHETIIIIFPLNLQTVAIITIKYNKVDACKGMRIEAPVYDVSFMQVVKTFENLFHNALHLPAIAKHYKLPKRKKTVKAQSFLTMC